MTIANRAQHQLRASSHAITPAGRFNIFVHGIAAEAEDLADLPVAFALRDERDAFDLARTERDAGQWPCPFAKQLARPIISDRAEQTGGQNLFCRSEEHTSELQSLMRTSYAVFCFKKKKLTTSNDRQQDST